MYDKDHQKKHRWNQFEPNLMPRPFVLISKVSQVSDSLLEVVSIIYLLHKRRPIYYLLPTEQTHWPCQAKQCLLTCAKCAGTDHLHLSIHFYILITKTYLYKFDPLKPHFYIVKLGLTGVYIIFLISAQNIDCGFSLEPPRRGGSHEYPQSMF